MIRSMTAFARQDTQTAFGNLVWELRSVNHRYLEVYLRMPEDYRSLESSARELINQRLSRGKVECNLQFKQTLGEGAQLRLQQPLLEQMARLNQQVLGTVKDARPLAVADILKWPGILEVPTPDPEEFGKQVLASLDKAISELIETRNREGAKLKQALRERLDSMSDTVKGLRVQIPEALAWIRERTLKRFEEVKIQLDPTRLEQEMVLYAQRSDVEEELKRLETHIDEVSRILSDRDDKPVGRRLDFLMQELNREANTLCSKSLNAETTRAGVDLKVLIEQMREQVQNIE